jgi:hypothetical protein
VSVKRLIPAVLLLGALAFANARADDGAYGSLVGLAKTAVKNPAPEAEEGDASTAQMKEALKDAVAQPPEPRSQARAQPPAETRNDDARVVTPAPSQGPRVWTRLYSSLIPSWRRAPAIPSLKSEFEPALSTAAVRAAPAAPAPAPDAVKAGERRGLSELLSASAVPADAQ